MHITTYIRLLLLTVFFLSSAVVSAPAQEDVIDNIKHALRSGNAKELAKYMNDGIELSIDGEKANYSIAQVEFVIKDFFRKYPPQDFQYLHQGSSGGGMKYAIGKYNYEKGTFRMFMVVKQVKGRYLVDTMDFSKE